MQDKFHVLTPKTDITESIYFDAIDYALKNESVHNIAISGPYGAGKSSIIHSYINKRKTDKISIVEDKCQINDITISLANIKVDSNQTDRTSVDVVEYAILEQLFFHKSCEKLPHSQFSRIKCLSKWDLITYILYTLTCFSFVFLWYNQSTLNLNIPGYLALLVFSLLLSVAVYKILPIIRNLSIRKISLATASIEVNDGKGQSVLNKHLDEILYFFQQTNTNVVVFEDLDRFDNIDLFVKLREINYLINNSESIEHNVVFIYALRDDIFQDKKLRTKFFDFLVPIIPYVDGTNAVDKLYTELKCEGISSKLCDILSYYIGDMRMVYNIINEFQIYKTFKSSEAEFDINKLLTIVAYKNCYPKDFAELAERRGVLYDVMQSKDCIVKQYKDDLQANIDELDKKIKRIKECQKIDLKALRIIYLNTILNDITQHNAITFSENRSPIKIDHLTSDEMFADIRSNQSIEFAYYYSGYSSLNYTRHSFNFKDIEKKVDKSQSYQEKEDAILERDTINDITAKINELQRELLIVEHYSYVNLLNEGGSIKNLDLENHQKTTSLYKQLELIEDLLACGFLNENYKMYLSLFHEGTIGALEQRFLIDVMRHKRNSFEYKLDRAEQLLERIEDTYFLNTPAVWNYDLIDALMIAEASTQKREYLFDSLMDTDGGLDFINEYVKHGKQVHNFIEALCDKFPEIWKELQNCRNITIDKNLWIKLLIKHARLVQIPKIFTNNEFHIANNGEYFLQADIPKERLYDIIRTLCVKFNKVHSSISNEDKEFIIQNNAYVINKETIENLIPFEYSKEQLEQSNYTFLHNKLLEPILVYVKENISTYLDELWIKLPKQNDSEEYIRELLLCCKGKNVDLKEIIKHTNISIQDIGTIINDELALEPFFDLEVVKPTWNNIKLVYEHCDEDLPKYLVRYLNKLHVYASLQGCLHVDLKQNNKTIENRLSRAIFYNKELSPSSLDALLNPTTTLEHWDSSLLSTEKVEKLIEGRKIAISLQTYNFLRLEYTPLHIKLLKNNFTAVLRSFDASVSFNAKEICVLSNAGLHTLQYKKLLQYIQPNAIIDATELQFIITTVERRDKTIGIDKVLAVILNKNVDCQKRIQIFLSYLDMIDNADIQKCMFAFDKPYSRVPNNYARIPFGELNEQLLNALKKRTYVSSFVRKKDYYLVYLRKSKVE